MNLAICGAVVLAVQLQAPVPAAPEGPAGPSPAADAAPVAAPLEVAPGEAAPGGTAPAEEPAPVLVAPLDATDPRLAPVELRPAPRKRFVFAFMPALTFGISALPILPSVSGSFFFGGRLRREGWALGLQATFSSGLADRYDIGLLAFRFHLTALHHFRARGFATIGGGVASFYWYPAIAEIETKVGVRLGKRKRALLGGLVRLGIDFFHRERAPLPQFGVFTGMSFL